MNRLDEIVEFEQLSREEIGQIVELQVAKLVRRVSERGVAVELTDEAKTLIGNLGYDPTYGARPLKRVIQKQLVDKLALQAARGRVRARRPRASGCRRRRAHVRQGRHRGRARRRPSGRRSDVGKRDRRRRRSRGEREPPPRPASLLRR